MQWLIVPVLYGLFLLTKHIIEEISKNNARKKWQAQANNLQKSSNSQKDDWENWRNDPTKDWNKKEYWQKNKSDTIESCNNSKDIDFFNYNENNNNYDENYNSIKIMSLYFSFFECMGQLAQENGRVSRAEADYIIEMMSTFELDDKTKIECKKAFNSGRNSHKKFSDLIDNFHRSLLDMPFDTTEQNQLKELYTECFCEFASIASITNSKVIKMLKFIGQQLETAHIVNKYLISSSKDIIPINQTCSLNDKYAILGVQPSASDTEIKIVYRKKSLEFHPDRLQGKGYSEEYKNFAKQEYLDIQEAYNEICKARGIK